MPSVSLDLMWAPASIQGRSGRLRLPHSVAQVAGPLDGASELLREQAEAAYRGWTEEECLGRRFPRTALAGVNNVEQ
jgi:hypothetical protein